MRDRVPWRSTGTSPRMPKRRVTSRTSSPRPTSTAAASALAALAALLIFCAPAAARRDEPNVPVTTILAAYDRATHADEVKTFFAEGTLQGEGLTGTFRTVRDGVNEREDDVMGPR